MLQGFPLVRYSPSDWKACLANDPIDGGCSVVEVSPTPDVQATMAGDRSPSLDDILLATTDLETIRVCTVTKCGLREAVPGRPLPLSLWGVLILPQMLRRDRRKIGLGYDESLPGAPALRHLVVSILAACRCYRTTGLPLCH